MRVVCLGQTAGPLEWHQDLFLLLVLAVWNSFSLDGYLAQPEYSGEGLRLSPKQCALPSLVSGQGVVWGREMEGIGGGEGVGTGIGMLNE